MSAKKDPWMRQCKFETVEPPIKIDVAWIDEKFAKVGKKVYFKDEGADPTEIWIITEVWSRKRESYVAKHERDYLHQRKASDI
jgi:hypothetical protein